MTVAKYTYRYKFYTCNLIPYIISRHAYYYINEGNRGHRFRFQEVWSDPYATLPGFVHLTKGPFSHERCSHASLSLFLFTMSCYAMPCHAMPCCIMSRRTRPRQADVVPPIQHPLSFPPILAAPFAEQWKCIDRRMARAGKRTGFPSQPPTLCLSVSLYPSVSSSPSPFSFSTVFFLLRSIFLSSETLSASSLCLCSPLFPPLFPSLMERHCLHPSISKRSVLLVATLVAVCVDYHSCTVAGSPSFPSFGRKYLCQCIVSRILPLFPRLVFPLPA